MHQVRSDILCEAIAVAIQKKIPELLDAELGLEYSYHSLPLCVIDSVFSIGVRYINAQKAVQSWCEAQQPPWQKFHKEGEPRKTISDLIRIANGHDADELSAKFFGGNRQRTSTRGGVLKSEAVLLFSKALKSVGIGDFPDIQDGDKAFAGRIAVSKVSGHGSGISFDYLMMMAGDESFVKADRMICRFVADATGLPTIDAEEARTAVVGACSLLLPDYSNVTPRLIDHLIWRYQRAQPANAIASPKPNH